MKLRVLDMVISGSILNALVFHLAFNLASWVLVKWSKSVSQDVKQDKENIEDEIQRIAAQVAVDLGLEKDKTLKLEWHKVANTRTRCLRITQKDEKIVRKKLQSK